MVVKQSTRLDVVIAKKKHSEPSNRFTCGNFDTRDKQPPLIAICEVQNPSKKKPKPNLVLLKCKVRLSNLLDVILNSLLVFA